MKWQAVKLYKALSKQDNVGQIKKVYAYIRTIEVVISSKISTTVANDIVYRMFVINAISKHKEFKANEDYMIEADVHQYKVDGFNCNGRYSQLILKEGVFEIIQDNLEVTFDGDYVFDGTVQGIKDGENVCADLTFSGKVEVTDFD